MTTDILNLIEFYGPDERLIETKKYDSEEFAWHEWCKANDAYITDPVNNPKPIRLRITKLAYADRKKLRMANQ